MKRASRAFSLDQRDDPASSSSERRRYAMNDGEVMMLGKSRKIIVKTRRCT